jgi:hypothetical protein
MTSNGRRAKVTPENKEEAKRLAKLWAERSHPSQAEFGELYEIGNQSAVGQFLRGNTPLSLKAARGFARGLGVAIEDFSPRLAAEAAAIANMVPGDRLTTEAAEIATAIDSLTGHDRERVLGMCRGIINLARNHGKHEEVQPKKVPKSRNG